MDQQLVLISTVTTNKRRIITEQDAIFGCKTVYMSHVQHSCNKSTLGSIDKHGDIMRNMMLCNYKYRTLTINTTCSRCFVLEICIGKMLWHSQIYLWGKPPVWENLHKTTEERK